MSAPPSVPTRRSVLAVALAALAGYVDAVGYLAFNGLFVAHMSGNSDRLGIYLVRGPLGRVAPPALAVALFVLSIAAGVAAMERGTRARWRAPSAVVLAAEAVLIALVAVVGGGGARGQVPQADSLRFYGLAAVTVAAMGLQTSALQRASGGTTRTTYVSGMLTRLAEGLVARGYRLADQAAPSYLRDELGVSGQGVWLVAGIWAAYIGGAAGGSYAHAIWRLAALWVPVGELAVLVAVDLRYPTKP